MVDLKVLQVEHENKLLRHQTETVVRAAMLLGLETGGSEGKTGGRAGDAEVHFGSGEDGSGMIRGTADVRCFGEKVRESRWRWFGHVQRRD